MQFSTCLKILKVTKNFGAILRENFFKESSSVRVHQKENRTLNINFNNQQEQTIKLASAKKLELPPNNNNNILLGLIIFDTSKYQSREYKFNLINTHTQNKLKFTNSTTQANVNNNVQSLYKVK